MELEKQQNAARAEALLIGERLKREQASAAEQRDRDLMESKRQVEEQRKKIEDLEAALKAAQAAARPSPPVAEKKGCC